MNIEVESLKDMGDIKDAIASPLEHFHSIVEPLHEATIEPFAKVVCDFVKPSLDSAQEGRGSITGNTFSAIAQFSKRIA